MQEIRYSRKPCRRCSDRRRYQSSGHCVTCKRTYDHRRTDVLRNFENEIRGRRLALTLRELRAERREQEADRLLRTYELGRLHGQQGRNSPMALEELHACLRKEAA
jgi:hypothetical protein